MNYGFSEHDLLECYARGVFPMADGPEDPRIFLIEPDWRGVLPLEGFHLPRSLRKTVRRDTFEVRVDQAFSAVVDGCAAPAPGRESTWINGPIRTLYGRLHLMGRAHSVETWRGHALVGGLYGVSLGGAFFGESMFSLETDASKVALCHLVARLKLGGYRLLDAQFLTDHLARFGAVEISRADYRTRLTDALAQTGNFYAAGSSLSGEAVVHAIGQTS